MHLFLDTLIAKCYMSVSDNKTVDVFFSPFPFSSVSCFFQYAGASVILGGKNIYWFENASAMATL